MTCVSGNSCGELKVCNTEEMCECGPDYVENDSGQCEGEWLDLRGFSTSVLLTFLLKAKTYLTPIFIRQFFKNVLFVGGGGK